MVSIFDNVYCQYEDAPPEPSLEWLPQGEYTAGQGYLNTDPFHPSFFFFTVCLLGLNVSIPLPLYRVIGCNRALALSLLFPLGVSKRRHHRCRHAVASDPD